MVNHTFTEQLALRFAFAMVVAKSSVMSIKSILLSVFFLGVMHLSYAQERTKLVYFSPEQPMLTSTSEERLLGTINGLVNSERYSFEIMGLLDTRKNVHELNDMLEKRAQNIVQLLKDNGVKESAIAIEAVPLNPLFLRDASRRDSVTNWIVKATIHPKQKKVVKPKAIPIERIFPKKTESLAVDPTKKQRLKCKEGTKISIPANTFVFEDGTLVKDPVELHVQEFYKTSDFLMANLSTSCNGEMIESGGMLKITARCSNREVFIQDGKAIDIKLPIGDEKKPGMEYFAGEETAQGVNWNLASELFDKKGRGQRANRNYYKPMVTTDNGIQQLINDSATLNLNDVNYINNLDVNVQRNQNNRNNNMTWNMSQSTLNLGNNAGDKYLLEVTDLGWINCDRFIQVEEKTPLMVSMDTTQAPSVKLVFKDINSVMSGYYDSSTNKYVFTGIPVGQKATLIAYSVTEDGAYFDSKEIIIKKDGSIEMDLNEVSESHLKSSFKRLNS